jgi:hypothetical protein
MLHIGWCPVRDRMLVENIRPLLGEGFSLRRSRDGARPVSTALHPEFASVDACFYCDEGWSLRRAGPGFSAAHSVPPERYTGGMACFYQHVVPLGTLTDLRNIIK